MDDIMDDVLKSIGWQTGFRLPIANKENQELERKLALLLIKKSNLQAKLEDSKERAKNLNEHMKFLEGKTKQSQELMHTYRTQLENEKHKLHLKTATYEKIQSETRRYAKQTKAVHERIASKKAMIARSLENLEKMKAQTEWNAEAKKVWVDAVKKHESNNAIMQQFLKEDGRKISELRKKRTQLQTLLSDKKALVMRIDGDILNQEQVLKRSRKMLTELKKERAVLINQWQEAVKTLRQKDAAIERAQQDLAKIQETLRIKQEQVAEKEALLANEQKSNKYLLAEITEVNIANTKLRNHLQALNAENQRLAGEEKIQLMQIQRGAKEQKALQLKLKEGQKLLARNTERLEKLEKEVAELEEQQLGVQTQKEDASLSLDSIDAMIEQTKKNKILAERKLQSLMNKQYHENMRVVQLTEMVDGKKSEVSALQNALGKIRKNTASASQLLIKKKQLLSDLQMKVACMEAHSTLVDVQDKGSEEREKQRAELKKGVEEQLKLKNLLRLQKEKLAKENLRLAAALSNDKQRLQKMKDKMQSLKMEIEGGEKLVKAAQVRKQKLQVAENVLRVKLEKLAKLKMRTNKEMFNAQQIKIDLEAALKQRCVEVNIAKDVLFGKKKMLEEERGKLRAELSQKVIRIKQLERKYEISLGLLGKDENDQPISICKFKIKMCQTRFQLQQEGDEMDKKIRKTEEEIVMIENTLKVVNGANSSFKKSVQFVDENSAEAKREKEINDSLIVQLAKNKELQDELIAETNKEKELLMLEEETAKRKLILEEEIDADRAVLEKMQKEEEERKEKIERATKQIKMSEKKIDPVLLEKYDRDLFITQLSDVNKSVMQQLASYAQAHLEFLPVFETYFASKQLQLPKVRLTVCTTPSESVPSMSSIRSSSSASSTSSSRSEPVKITNVELKFDELPKSAKGQMKKPSQGTKKKKPK